jgi:hypothetical protein
MIAAARLPLRLRVASTCLFDPDGFAYVRRHTQHAKARCFIGVLCSFVCGAHQIRKPFSVFPSDNRARLRRIKTDLNQSLV